MAIPAIRVTLESLLHRSLSTRADVDAWLADWAYVQSNQFNPDLVAPSLKTTLDHDNDFSLTRRDRDFWLDQWLKKYLPETPRLPWVEEGSAPASDPLSLTSSPPSNERFVIIDPANKNAVVVLRNSNNCTLQDGTADGEIWDGGNPQVYRRALWRDCDCLDETHFDSIKIPSTVRRFPTANNIEVTVYVRGGLQVLSKEIHLRLNNNSWFHPTKLVIRNYPGERPELYIGSSKIAAGEPHDFYVGKYRHLYPLLIERRDFFYRGIKTIWWRMEGANRIFSMGKGLRYKTDFGPGCVIGESEFLDCKGISPTSGDAGAYPLWVDAAFESRVRTDTVLNKTDFATPGAGSTTVTSASGGFTSSHVGYHIRIVSGTNFVAGNYLITAFTSGTQVTVATSPTPGGAGSSGVGTVDGIFLSKTDLATPGAGSTTLTSATGGFTSGMVGRHMRINSGTNFVAGWYNISAFTSGTQVTLSTSPTPSGAGSAGVGFLGGIDPGDARGDWSGEIHALIHLQWPGCMIENSHIRFAAESSAPFPDAFIGDAIRSGHSDQILRRLWVDGATPHSGINLTDSSANSIVEYCDASNVDNSAIGASGDGSIVQYNRIHKYGYRVATSHNALQYQGVTNGIVRGNVIWDPGLSEDGWGLALFGDTTLNNDLDGNEISYNIVYGCGVALIHTLGIEEARVKNNKLHHNVFIDTSPGNAAISGGQRDAPIYVLIGDGEANAAYGNAINANLIGRLDASDNMMVTWYSGAGYRYYDVDEYYPLWVGNFTADPKFVDPTRGDFTMQIDSPVYDWFDSNVPLHPRDSAQFYNAIDAAFDG